MPSSEQSAATHAGVDLSTGEQHLQSIIETYVTGIAIVNLEGNITFANPAAEQILGLAASQSIGRRFNDPRWKITTFDGQAFPEDELPFVRVLSSRQPVYNVEHAIARPDGHRVMLSVNATPLRDPRHEMIGVIASISDITRHVEAEAEIRRLNMELEQRVSTRTAELWLANQELQHEIADREHAEAALRESEVRFRSTFNDAAVGMSWVAPDGHWLQVNGALCEILGYTRSELLGMTFQMVTHPADLDDDLTEMQRLLAGEISSYHLEKRYFHKLGHIIWVLLTVSVARNIQHQPIYFVSQIQDISERKQAEAHLLASLAEKEVLLKEIHHRVKNNLQIISSLLRMQSHYINVPQVAELFQEAQNRVKAMALVHEKLYRSADLAHIDFAGYIHSLANNLFRSYNVRGKTITLQVETPVLFLDIDTAIPCGLMLNELVSNCLKHAFPDDRSGTVCIKLAKGSSQSCVLTVGDNGIGLPLDLDWHHTTSLGLQLLNTLVQQLSGTIMLDRTTGTAWTITFPIKE